MLEARGVCKSYRGVRVLLPVSFRLDPGECLGLSGPNGSGKSTLLRLLAQTERPDSGQVLFRGRDVRGDRQFLRKSLGYVPQDSELAPELTGAQQLRLWKAACGLRGPLPGEISGLLDLGPLMDRRIGEMSGGMQKRVSLAMALAAGPEVLILDEVTAGLDAEFTEALLGHLEKFLREGGCAVWCSHRENELDRLCRKRLRLEAGRPVPDRAAAGAPDAGAGADTAGRPD